MADIADNYRAAVQAASKDAVAAEPEAQLTTPVSVLLQALCAEAGLGDLTLIREAHLEGVRPDFAALIQRHPCGWVELKAPGHTVDGGRWGGREKRQWERLATLDSLIVTNGEDVALYNTGTVVRTAALPYTDAPWDRDGLIALLQLFVSTRPATVTRVGDLAHRLAPLTAMLRDKVRTLAESPASDGEPVREALAAWRASVDQDATGARFADDLAQVVAYSLAIAGLGGQGDTDGDGYLSLSEAKTALSKPNGALAATLGPVLGTTGLVEDALAPEVGAIERLVSQIDVEKIHRSRDTRGEPWLWFYEDFLAAYDPEARKKTGVYFTPVDVVDCQVRLTEHILRERLGKQRGFADQHVTTLDPASGSGTYPLAVIERAVQTVRSLLGEAGGEIAAKQLEKNLLAFELLPGPYAVTSLRMGTVLAEHHGAILATPHVRAYLTDTLEDPDAGINVPQGLFGDAKTLAAARAQAAAIKSNEPITVVIGNPPYGRTSGDASGGWVLHGSQDGSAAPIFDDVLTPAREAGVIFSAHASLYDNYVYFWRWAIWKAMQGTDRPAVVSFITSSNWIRGAAFLGLRALARRLGDEIWVVDLGGDGRGTSKEENVFAIQTPVAIVTIFRAGASKRSRPASVFYQRLVGTRAEKLNALQSVAPPDQAPEQWLETTVDKIGSTFVPDTSDAEWTQLPTIDRLFPWRQPGTKFNRAWPIAPARSLLDDRWLALMDTIDNNERATRFVTAKTGRNVFTRVTGLKPIAELPRKAEARPLVRYGYRSFDRQWTFADPRLIALERPSAWASASDHQIFFTSMMTQPLGDGPALTLSTEPPDMHHFRGSYGGKDVTPLYRTDGTESPNITAGLLDLLADTHSRSVTPEDLAAYTYALLAHPGYTETFSTDLAASPVPRVPLTADPAAFERALAFGRDLLWLHSFGARWVDPAANRPLGVPRHPSVGWKKAVNRIPADPTDVELDRRLGELTVGDGILTGVRADVWDFAVSGFQPVRQWFGQRTRKGVGRAASAKATPLDKIRPTTWDDDWNTEALELITVITRTLDGYPDQALLLGDVLAGELLPLSSLPLPSAPETGPPTPAQPWYL